MSNLESIGLIVVTFFLGAAVVVYETRTIWEIEQNMADEKRTKVRWMLLFNRHIPMMVAVIFSSAVLAFALAQIGRNVTDDSVRVLAYVGAVFYGATSLNVLVMGTLTNFKRASLLREAERRSGEAPR